ncbi:hypothetical protein CM49_03765 [Paenibacillus sp. P1XP2]|nr:hypothetical protein CM49_03765 [Paenibacillus sp. P1XP2]
MYRNAAFLCPMEFCNILIYNHLSFSYPRGSLSRLGSQGPHCGGFFMLLSFPGLKDEPDLVKHLVNKGISTNRGESTIINCTKSRKELLIHV